MKPTASLDEILEAYTKNPRLAGMAGVKHLNKAEAKQAIKNYILEIIPEEMHFDDPILAEHNEEWTEGHNQAIEEMKDKLEKRP